MTTLERLASAAVESIRADDRVYTRAGENDDLSDVLVDGDVDFIRVVRAILTTLREPTMDMGLAGADLVNKHMRGAETPADYDAAMDSFKAMIDEILKEGQ